MVILAHLGTSRLRILYGLQWVVQEKLPVFLLDGFIQKVCHAVDWSPMNNVHSYKIWQNIRVFRNPIV